MPSHLWLIQWADGVSDQFSALLPNEKSGFLAKMRELALADDPYTVPGVEALQEKRFKDRRKIRKGNYRMFFKVEIGGVVDHKFTYKGRLIILAIKNRRDAYE